MEVAEICNSEYYIGKFGDERLLKKGIILFKKMCEKLTMNIRKLSGDRSLEVGIHRFLDNDTVTQEEIEKSIAQKTVKNIGDLEEVLTPFSTFNLS